MPEPLFTPGHKQPYAAPPVLAVAFGLSERWDLPGRALMLLSTPGRLTLRLGARRDPPSRPFTHSSPLPPLPGAERDGDRGQPRTTRNTRNKATLHGLSVYSASSVVQEEPSKRPLALEISHSCLVLHSNQHGTRLAASTPQWTALSLSTSALATQPLA